MSLSTEQMLTLEHLEFLYWNAVEDRDVDTVNAILQKMRDCGWSRESKRLLERTPLNKLVTKGCVSTWETDDPTQETL